eukprot:CAMPEP_0182894300 /NCGR_PEP_ID=MMETSP0034_2-20130328/24994_1 /TAXON_ID=156128 /ORGANISM="Nephroselmis pyriformis, Strain CCMP717" /LENGTH=312 /DNA_ID=CAMNT_0025028079 /DNA_START=293 /DNA_END=1228 /DNA_ORIENTATION=-
MSHYVMPNWMGVQGGGVGGGGKKKKNKGSKGRGKGGGGKNKGLAKNIRRLIETGDVDQAAWCFAQEYRWDPPPQDVCLQLLMAMCKSGRLSEAPSVLDFMMGRGYQVKVGECVNILTNLSQRADMASALALFDGMLQLCEFEIPGAREHFTKYARLSLIEFIAEAEGELQRIQNQAPESLENRGLALLRLEVTPTGKGGLFQLAKMGMGQGGQPGFGVQDGLGPSVRSWGKGDAVLLTPSNPAAVPFEGEVQTSAPLVIKQLTAASQVADRHRMAGEWRADKMGNRVGYRRMMVGLQRLAELNMKVSSKSTS